MRPDDKTKNIPRSLVLPVNGCLVLSSCVLCSHIESARERGKNHLVCHRCRRQQSRTTAEATNIWTYWFHWDKNKRKRDGNSNQISMGNAHTVCHECHRTLSDLGASTNEKFMCSLVTRLNQQHQQQTKNVRMLTWTRMPPSANHRASVRQWRKNRKKKQSLETD